MARWTYSAELLEALGRFGLAPGPETPPRLVRDQCSDLYRWEIRRLRAHLLAGEFPKADYVGHVIALRKKYWPLSFTPAQWESLLVSAGDAEGIAGGTEGDGVHGDNSE